MKFSSYYYLVLDIETSVLKDNEGNPVLTWLSYGYCILYERDGKKDTICYFREWEELQKFFDEICIRFPNRLLICFVHNLGFEFEFLIRNVGTATTALSNSTHAPISATLEEYPSIEFRCTYKITGMSLKKLGDLVGLKKLDDDYGIILPGQKISEKKKKYCLRDCDVVAKYISDVLLKQYGNFRQIPYTKTGVVRNMYKEFYNEYKKKNEVDWDYYPPEDCYQAMLDAFTGGCVIVNPMFFGIVLKDVDSYDMTSAYPFAQLSEQYPYSIEKELNPDNFDLSKPFWIAKIKFHNIKSRFGWGWLSVSKMNEYDELKSEFFNGKLLSASCIVRTITNTDFESINMTYIYDDYEILEYYKMERYGDLPDPYINTIDYYAKLKGDLKVKRKEIEEEYGENSQEFIDVSIDYMFSKNNFNSIYGMTVQKLTNKEFIIDEYYHWIKKDVKYKQKTGHAKRNFLFGVYVTAYTRRNLIKAIVTNCPYTLAYTDTDSIKGWFPNGFIDTNKVLDKYKEKKHLYKLGRYDYEGKYTYFINWGAKKYAYQHGDRKSPINFTVAGLPKLTLIQDGKYIKPKYELNGIEYQMNDISEFKPGIIFRNCKLAKKFITVGHTFEIDEENEITNMEDHQEVFGFMRKYNIKTNGGVALFDVDYSLGITKNDKMIAEYTQKLLPEYIEKYNLEGKICLKQGDK